MLCRSDSQIVLLFTGYIISEAKVSIFRIFMVHIFKLGTGEAGEKLYERCITHFSPRIGRKYFIS